MSTASVDCFAPEKVAEVSCATSSPSRSWFPYVAALVVLVSRISTSGQPYFADGPSHIDAIKEHIYAIQPPGYWLFTRLASLFADPAMGIHYINWTASALGVFVFYFVAKRMIRPVMAELATVVYGSLYIAWFAGNIHSTYATELFFPVLMVFFILRNRENQNAGDLVGVSLAFALAAGFRPSDGFFLSPLFLFFLVKYVPSWKRRALTVALVFGMCLAWFVPNQMAMREAAARNSAPHSDTNLTQLRSVAPITSGSVRLFIANEIRVVLPLALSFWPLIPWLFRRDEFRESRILVWLWMLPGLSFFLLVYMSDASYLCYLLGGVVLSACIGTVTRKKVCAVLLCVAFNIGFYMWVKPVPITSAVTAVFDIYGAKYTRWGVKNQYFKTLRDVYPIGRLTQGIAN